MSGPIHTSSSKSVASKPPFLAFVTTEVDATALKTFASAHNFGDLCVLQGDIATATEFLRSNPSPSVLLVEIPSAEAAPALLDKLADVCDPGTKVVIVGDVNEYSFYCWLTDIGIASYLLKPLGETALESMYQKATEPPPAVNKQAREPGKVIGIMGTRGGAGATTLTINLAGLTARTTSKKVAIADLDPQDGSVSLLLDLEPSRGLREALDKPDRIDTLFLDRVMMKAEDRLHVLSAEESFAEKITYHDQAAEALISTMKEKFDIIFIDLPRQFNTFTKNCLKACDSVVVVSDLSLHGLRDAMRYNDTFRDHLKLKNVSFVANRIGLAPKQEVALNDFEKNLGHTLTARIPFAPEQFMETGPEFPALKNMHSPVAKTLQTLLFTLLPDVQGAEEEAHQKKALLGLFKHAKK